MLSAGDEPGDATDGEDQKYYALYKAKDRQLGSTGSSEAISKLATV